MKKEQEQWKCFKEAKVGKCATNKCYWWVSNEGRIKRTFNYKDDVIYVTPTLSGGHKDTRYLCLSENDFKYVHRIVAQMFIPNPLNKPTVNHKDFNKQNNNVTNLEWATYRENQLHYNNNNK